MAGEADEPAGFLMACVVDGCLHIDQVSVDPGSARRGLGRAIRTRREPGSRWRYPRTDIDDSRAGATQETSAVSGLPGTKGEAA